MRVHQVSLLALGALLLAGCDGSGSDGRPPAYGYAGPPGGAMPQLGFQATTFRALPGGADATEVWTHGTAFAAGYPYLDPSGLLPAGNAGASNLLPTVERPMRDILGRRMPNTLPSTRKDPYALHERRGDPGEDAFGVIATPVDPTSPRTDLIRILRIVKERAELTGAIETALLKVGVNVLEGVGLLTDLSPAEVSRAQLDLELLDGTGAVRRAYEGFPLLHYRNGADRKTKTLQRNADGGWEVRIDQVWYDSHIESDTAFLDVSPALNEEWVVEYHVHVLDDGHDDFAPFVMYFSRGPDAVEAAPPNDVDAAVLAAAPRAPHVAMDTTFFPMEVGNSYRLRVRHAPGKYYNLSYHWGWRVHPPRVQATENAGKTWPGPTVADPMTGDYVLGPGGDPTLVMKSLPEWERDVFGNADAPGYDRRAVIAAQIGDLAPAKRMWSALLAALASSDPVFVAQQMDDAEDALHDWGDRTRLPRGVTPDPASDLTMIYLNNTLYAEWADGRRLQRWVEYQTRAGNERTPAPDSFQVRQDSTLDVTLLNGDRFVHGYLNVDFGGARGWENMFGSSIASGGSGAWFSFGRVRWWINAGAGPQTDPGTGAMGAKDPIFVRPVTVDGAGNELVLGRHDLTLHFNYDPTRRLRMYQFDPLHHDVAVFSLH